MPSSVATRRMLTASIPSAFRMRSAAATIASRLSDRRATMALAGAALAALLPRRAREEQ